jgi:Mrp family chromosome partitioning ATPase
VGKSTVAVALAAALVARGEEVLLAEVSADVEGPSVLGPRFGLPAVGAEPRRAGERLSLVQVSAAEGHRRFLQEVVHSRLMAEAAVRSKALRRFLEAGPAFRELGVLYHLLSLLRQERRDGRPLYPRIVVDLPATGHALALAQLPAMVLRFLPGGPIGTAVREGHDFLRDKAKTGVVLVTLPERLPVSEVLELSAALVPLELSHAATVVNRVPPDPFTPAQREEAARVLESHPKLWGARLFGRLTRAREALGLLREAPVHRGADDTPGGGVPLLQLQELPASDALTPSLLATALSAGLPGAAVAGTAGGTAGAAPGAAGPREVGA